MRLQHTYCSYSSPGTGALEWPSAGSGIGTGGTAGPSGPGPATGGPPPPTGAGGPPPTGAGGNWWWRQSRVIMNAFAAHLLVVFIAVCSCGLWDHRRDWWTGSRTTYTHRNSWLSQPQYKDMGSGTCWCRYLGVGCMGWLGVGLIVTKSLIG